MPSSQARPSHRHRPHAVTVNTQSPPANSPPGHGREPALQETGASRLLETRSMKFVLSTFLPRCQCRADRERRSAPPQPRASSARGSLERLTGPLAAAPVVRSFARLRTRVGAAKHGIFRDHPRSAPERCREPVAAPPAESAAGAENFTLVLLAAAPHRLVAGR